MFSGGFGLEAVEEVVGAGEPGAKDVLDLLGSLIEQSLVVSEPNALEGVRYWMLEPIRQYALEWLDESGEMKEARERHAAYYLALAELAEPSLTGPSMVEWLDRMEAERANLRAASWMLSNGWEESSIQLIYMLRRFFWSLGPHREVYSWMEEALAFNVAMSSLARAQAIYAAQLMRYRMGGGIWSGNPGTYPLFWELQDT